MSIEYEGQSIQSMKWNGQEIFGGGVSGGIVTQIDDVYLPVKISSSPYRRYQKSRIKYVRFYDEDESVYRTVLNFPDALTVAGSYGSATADYSRIKVGVSTSSDDYVIPEGFRPADYSMLDPYIVKGDLAYNTYYQYIYLRSDFKMYCQGSSSSGRDTFYIGPNKVCTYYICDYTGE